MNAPSQDLVRLDQVEVTYRLEGASIPVLTGVDLRVAPGEFVSLMGPSGSGKSTILNLIAGLQPPTAGQVLVQGDDLYALDDAARTLVRRRTIGFVFQFFNLVPSLNVWDNTALPLWIAGEDPTRHTDRVESLLERVGLGGRERHRPGQLSGGELQRVTLARALVTRPALLLADEPTGNVSAKMGAEILDLLQEVHRDLGQAILLVTHAHRDAARGQRVVFLKDGSIPADHILEGEEVDEARVLSVLQELDV